MYNNSLNQKYSSSNQNSNNSSGINNFEDNPRLNSIDPMKLKIINEIRRQSKTKPMEELIPEVMRINQELTRRNINFTKEESSLLLDAIEESLSPADRKKFQMLKSFL